MIIIWDNMNPQSPAVSTGTGGSVEVSRFEKDGVNRSYNFFEMEGTVNATMQDIQTAVVCDLVATIKNAFIAEFK